MNRAHSSASQREVLFGLCWLCLALLLAGCGGALQPHAPDPEQGRSVAKAYEAAFNGGWSELDRFEQRHWVKVALGPSDERRGRYLTRQRGMGRIRMHRIELEGELMVALVQTEFGDWVKCSLVFGDGGDHLLDVRWLQTSAPESERGPASEQEYASQLHQFLDRFAKDGGFSGAVLEGKPFAQVVNERIYAKANMKHATRLANAADVAVPYASIMPGGSGKLEYGPERDARRFLPLPAPFGCSFATVRDMYEFSRALLAGRLVSKQSLELMIKTDRTGPGDLVDHYGYGVMTDLIHGVPYFGHDGGVWGVNAVFRMTPAHDVIIVLSNVSPGAAQRAAMRAADQLARLPKNAEQKPNLATPDDVGLR